MGTSKLEKRMKKVKRQGCDVVDDGEAAGHSSLFECDDKHDITGINEDDAAGAEVIVHKSKKARKRRKNETFEQSTLLNNEEHFKPVGNFSSKGKKDKSKKAHKHKTDTSASGIMSVVVNDGEECKPVVETHSKGRKDKFKKAHKNRQKDALVSIEQSTKVNIEEEGQPENEVSSKGRKGKAKRGKSKKDSNSAVAETNSVQEVQEVAEYDVYQISEEVDDCKGMRKWIKEYNEKRPGLKILQDRIDDFITAHDEQQEQARRERDARLAEEGWTVVVHRKGGKKTTDSESGVAVGSVAEAAVLDKLAKKKSKDVGLDFYRFQRKEAHRSEIMKLQSKFEEDKKRIQQIRAARKFRPY